MGRDLRLCSAAAGSHDGLPLEHYRVQSADGDSIVAVVAPSTGGIVVLHSAAGRPLSSRQAFSWSMEGQFVTCSVFMYIVFTAGLELDSILCMLSLSPEVISVHCSAHQRTQLSRRVQLII